MEHLRCVAERITFENEETGFAVIKCRARGYQDLVAVVGNLAGVHVGSVLTVAGDWKIDRKYGRQFSVKTWEETLPATVYGIEKYLGSGLIRGIGPKFAKEIVDRFGADTLNIIEKNPEELLSLPGIGRRRVEQVKKSWEEHREIKNLMLFLQEHDVSTAYAVRIYRAYGADSIDVITENPYRLADEVRGIGFRTADTIARAMGMEKDRFVRLRCGLAYSLNRLADEGHCYALREQLTETAVKLLEVEEGEISITLDEMIRSGDVILEEGAIYLAPFYCCETGCAKGILRLLHGGRRVKINVPAALRHVQDGPVTYEEVQREAIRTALTSKVCILTGGPGTGKTTTTGGIIEAFRAAGCEVLLAAPTGRAARRMSEATGLEAKTIHRLLEYKPPEGYQRNEEHPLEADVLIVDECSMIDLVLMYNLLKALPDTMTLILVGDVDQLPSVGAGCVLKDLIASECVPTVRLVKIFRQAEGSRIVQNAHRINRGEMPDLRGGKDSDFFFASRTTNEETADLVVQYCTRNLPAYYHADPFQQIQVLNPMQKGVCGAAHFTQLLQKALNPEHRCLRRGGTEYRMHDKVMQIRNDYGREVFNGDIGWISLVDEEGQRLAVNFDGRDVLYDLSDLDELVLSYAVTVHKAQGSEFPIVVMPVTMSHALLLQRNLLYTAVTRAKKVLVMVGEKKAVAYAVGNDRAESRNTRLARRLRALSGKQAGTAMKPEEPQPSRPQKDARFLRAAEPGPVYRTDRTAPASHADLFARLSRSAFRSRFTLSEQDRAYVQEKGMDVIRSHAQDFVRKRLAPAVIPNDGKQTPMKGHPVFLAQHATATCCRGCLEKWHRIPKGRELTGEEQEYVVDVILEWIRRQMEGESEKEKGNGKI